MYCEQEHQTWSIR